MRLTLWTDYALRTLMFVGSKGGRLATIAEIAESFDISKAHLMKVVNKLGQQGYLDTARGKGGGIKLARSPRKSRWGDCARDGRGPRRGGLPRRNRVLPDRGMLCSAPRATRGHTRVFANAGRLHPGRPLGASCATGHQLGA